MPELQRFLDGKDLAWKFGFGPFVNAVLSWGGYKSNEVARHLKFFLEWALPTMLGSDPVPSDILLAPSWKSFMTNDHTPMEMSLRWKDGSGMVAPQVHYTIDIAPDYRQGRMSAYRNSIKLFREMGSNFSGGEASAYLEHDCELWSTVTKQIATQEDELHRECSLCLPSAVCLGFALSEDSAKGKAYWLLPQCFTPIQKISLLEGVFAEGVLSLFSDHEHTNNWRIIKEHIIRHPTSTLTWLAIDKVKAQRLRVKVYAIFRMTDCSFHDVEEHLSLRGKIAHSTEYLSTANSIWSGLCSSHQQPSYCALYYEMGTDPVSGKARLSSKLCIPTQELAEPDSLITSHLPLRYASIDGDPFISALLNIPKPTAFINYIGLDESSRGGVDLILYVSPSIYSKQAWDSKDSGTAFKKIGISDCVEIGLKY